MLEGVIYCIALLIPHKVRVRSVVRCVLYNVSNVCSVCHMVLMLYVRCRAGVEKNALVTQNDLCNSCLVAYGRSLWTLLPMCIQPLGIPTHLAYTVYVECECGSNSLGHGGVFRYMLHWIKISFHILCWETL